MKKFENDVTKTIDDQRGVIEVQEYALEERRKLIDAFARENVDLKLELSLLRAVVKIYQMAENPEIKIM